MTRTESWLQTAFSERARAYLCRSRRFQVALGLLCLWLVAALVDYPGGEPASMASALQGARGSAVAVVGVLAIAVPLGWSLGLLAGAGPRIADTLLARAIEFGGVLPTVVLVAVVVAAEPTAESFVLVVGVTRALYLARIVRGEALRVSHAAHVMAARALGVSRLRVLTGHVSPPTLGPLLVGTAFTAAATLGLETTLSFMGLGLSQDAASWGSQLSSSSGPATAALAVAIALATGACVLLADVLDDALSPHRSLRRLPAGNDRPWVQSPSLAKTGDPSGAKH
jgi:oligopeptide transport system permease protein